MTNKVLRDERGFFVKGTKAGPGRGGAKSRLSKRFIEALSDDFDKNGNAVIAEVRQQRPADYLKIIAMIVRDEAPAQTGEAFDDLSEEELMERLANAHDRVGEIITRGVRSASGDTGTETTH